MYSTGTEIKYILRCLFSSPDLVVLFIVLPHTHCKTNTVLIGHRQVPPLHERKKIAKSLKIVQGH